MAIFTDEQNEEMGEIQNEARRLAERLKAMARKHRGADIGRTILADRAGMADGLANALAFDEGR